MTTKNQNPDHIPIKRTDRFYNPPTPVKLNDTTEVEAKVGVGNDNGKKSLWPPKFVKSYNVGPNIFLLSQEGDPLYQILDKK